jgi:putative autotransporter adhesin-like protein
MFRIAALPVLAALMVAGCFTMGGVQGTGDVVTAKRDVGPFTRIHVSGTTSLTVQIGSPASVTVEAQQNIADLIETTVSGDALDIRDKERYQTSATAAVHVTVPSLSAVALRGASSARLDGFHGGDLEISISGAGDVQASGTVDNLNVSCSGTGNAQLERLAAQNADVSLAGVGNANLNVQKGLSVSIAGVGSVTYTGTARIVHQQISGLGHVSHE